VLLPTSDKVTRLCFLDGVLYACNELKKLKRKIIMKKIFSVLVCLTFCAVNLTVSLAQSKPASGQNVPEKTEDKKTEDEKTADVSIFFSGNLSNAPGQGSSNGSTELNGSVGFNITDTTTWEFDALITGLSIPDTVKQEYGSNFLITKKGLTSIELSANWRPFTKKNNWFWLFRKIGFYGYFTTSNGLWKYGDSLIRTSNLGYGLGAMVYINGIMNDDKHYKVMIGFGITARGLVGDIGQADKTNLRMRLLNTDKTLFWGTDFSVTLGFENFTVTARYIGLRKGDGNDVIGLTKGQLFNSVIFKTSLNIGHLSL
jgi:hypothetical protein